MACTEVKGFSSGKDKSFFIVFPIMHHMDDNGSAIFKDNGDDPQCSSILSLSESISAEL